MIWMILATGLVVAVLRGGRLRPDITFRDGWIAPVALAVQFLAYRWPGTLLGATLMVGSYLALMFCLIRNFRYEAMRFILVGLALNMMVSALNGGRLPVDLETARAVGVDVSVVAAGQDPRHVAIGDKTIVPFLGDVIPVAWPVQKVVSTGDLFVYFGVFLMIQEVMGRRLSLVGTAESGLTHTR